MKMCRRCEQRPAEGRCPNGIALIMCRSCRFDLACETDVAKYARTGAGDDWGADAFVGILREP